MANHESDDDEIEQHLIKKIDQAIDVSGPQQNLVHKIIKPLEPQEFRDLLIILEKKTNEHVVQDWRSVRRENLYQLNNLLTDWHITKSQSSFSIIEIHNSYENIRKTLRKMMKEVTGQPADTSIRGDDAADAAAAEGSDSYHHQEPERTIFVRNKDTVYRWSSRHKPRNVYGFEYKVKSMERDLVMRNINDPYKVFGVVGVAGIGKTTICQDIFNRSSVKKHFSPRLWVCLSKQPRDHNNDYKQEVVVRILKSLGIEDDVINAAGNAGQYGLKRLILLLRLQLIGKRYLIVFDDAWYEHKNDATNVDRNNADGHAANVDDGKKEDTFFLNLTKKEELDENWGHELAYGLPKGCGGTIIASSRSQALLKKMLGKDVSLQYLKPQNKENIEKIFNDAVTGYDEDKIELPDYFETLKGEILRKCDGIPLAAKLLAKIARERWQSTPQKPISAGGGLVPAGGNAGGGGEPKPKLKNYLPPIRSDQVASTADKKVTGN